MLVISRKIDERVFIGDNIVVKVLDVRGDRVRFGIEAPKDIEILREEIKLAIERIKNTDDTRPAA